MKPTYKEIHDFISAITSHVLFEYKGKSCGIDPINRGHIDVWYGDKMETMTNMDDVFHLPFFDGKSFTEIFNELDLDY